MKQNSYPHVFQPITIRGLTLKNRLEYAPTVVLKCNADGTMSQDMLDFMQWQAKTGVGWVTVGDTPVTHDNTSHWLCEMNVCDDDCIHGMNALVEQARKNGAELSAELAYAGRGNRANPDGEPIAIVSAERPLNPGDNVRTMNRADMDDMKERYVDCALRCKHAGFRMVMIHCAHNNFLAQWLSPDSNVRTDEYGGSPENRRKYPLEVLKAIREAVGEDMVIELRVSATEGIPGGLEFEESLAFMELAQEYVDIMHVSQGSIFHLSARYTIPTYFREPHKPLNVDYAAEVKKHLHIPVAVVGMITTLEQAEEIIASGKADIVAMAKSFMADGDIVHKSLAGQADQVRPCTRCDLCGNANTWGTSMSCAINPRCGIDGEIQPVPQQERKRVLVIGGGPAGMMAAQTLVKRGHCLTVGALPGLYPDPQLPLEGQQQQDLLVGGAGGAAAVGQHIHAGDGVAAAPDLLQAAPAQLFQGVPRCDLAGQQILEADVNAQQRSHRLRFRRLQPQQLLRHSGGVGIRVPEHILDGPGLWNQRHTTGSRPYISATCFSSST